MADFYKAGDSIKDFVGGQGEYWEILGEWQMELLLKHGLKPHHKLIDVACGSLRLGRLAIDFLDNGRYFGIEKEAGLLEEAKKVVIPHLHYKEPTLLADGDFDFGTLLGHEKVDFGMCNSLFTHLPEARIHECLSRLRYQVVGDDFKLIATFFLGNEVAMSENPPEEHPHKSFYYVSPKCISNRAGWDSKILSDANHPRKQSVYLLTPRP